jgi:hypothetical protein
MKNIAQGKSFYRLTGAVDCSIIIPSHNRPRRGIAISLSDVD